VLSVVRLALHLTDKLPDLIHCDDARLGLGPHPMRIAVVAMIDLAADQAFATAINGHLVLSYVPFTVEDLCQRAGDNFQFVQVMAAEQVPMSQPPMLQRTLQQLHALRVPRKIFECHRAWNGGARLRSGQLESRISL